MGDSNRFETFRTQAGEELFEDLADEGSTQAQRPVGSLRSWMETAERWRILEALRHCQGNRSAAARELRIGRRTLYAKMERLGIGTYAEPRGEALVGASGLPPEGLLDREVSPIQH